MSRYVFRPSPAWSDTPHLTRFAGLLGQPPSAYVLRQRLDRAARLLVSTTESVVRIATHVGYTLDAAFSRAYAASTNLAPDHFP